MIYLTTVQNLIVAKLYELHKLQDRTFIRSIFVESLRFLRISGPPCNNGTAPYGTSAPPCSSKYFYNPRLWPRIRSLSIIRLVLKWKRMELPMRRSTSRIVALHLSFPSSLQMRLYWFDWRDRSSWDWLINYEWNCVCSSAKKKTDELG